MYKLFVAIVVTSLLSACGGGGGSESSSNSNSDAQLSGVWSICNMFNNTSTESIHVYSGNTFSYSFATYSDSPDCSSMPLTSSEIISGTFTIGDAVESANGFDAFELDLHVDMLLESELDEDNQYTDLTIFSFVGDELFYAAIPQLDDRPLSIDDTRAYTQN